jgi:hypothetical protein
MEAKAIPVVCDHKSHTGNVLEAITADGKPLIITSTGATYDGWTATWPLVVLALQDAARGATYVKDGNR